MSEKRPEKILVIKLSALGDVILALGPMAAIRKAHPDAHITLLTMKPFVDIAQRSRYFDAIETESRAPFWNLAEGLRIFRFLNRGQFTRVYDLQMNDRTSLYYRLFLRKPEWSGILKGASHSYDDLGARALHAFERHKAVLARAGVAVEAPDLSWMTSDVSLFGLKSPYVLLVPGSAPAHPHKRWPALNYGALALRLMRDGYDVAVLGTASERDVIDRVVKSCPGCRDLSGKTSLYDIATLARGAAAAVGNDTGPMHLIGLVGCPAVSLFSGATDPARSAPVGRAVTVIQSDPIDGISVDDVIKNFHPRTQGAAA
jgi:ADP-heptose:LPS heptosyltransferase